MSAAQGTPVIHPERVLFWGLCLTFLLSSQRLALSKSTFFFLTFLYVVSLCLKAFVGEHATLFCYIMDQIKQQVGLGTASPGVGTLTLIIQSGLLLGSAGRARCATVQVWPLWESLCQKWDVLSSDTERMATAFSRCNSVLWSDYFKVTVITFKLKNYY